MWCSWGFSSDFAGKNGRGDDEECTGGRVRERSVCVVCCVDWKGKRKGEQEWEWPAKERKEGVDCVMGSGVRWGARGNQQFEFFFFFLTDGTLHNNHKQMSNVGLKIELN